MEPTTIILILAIANVIREQISLNGNKAAAKKAVPKLKDGSSTPLGSSKGCNKISETQSVAKSQSSPQANNQGNNQKTAMDSVVESNSIDQNYIDNYLMVELAKAGAIRDEETRKQLANRPYNKSYEEEYNKKAQEIQASKVDMENRMEERRKKLAKKGSSPKMRTGK